MSDLRRDVRQFIATQSEVNKRPIVVQHETALKATVQNNYDVHGITSVVTKIQKADAMRGGD
jgi:hypothetical protein